VIAVPAAFTHIQRRETAKAARTAGLKVLRILTEPTAVALAFARQKKFTGKKTIFVFDFGGGTLDVAIVEIAESRSRLINIAGDSHLGGRDLDERLVNICLDRIQETHRIDLRNHPKRVAILKEQCEKAKCRLSNAPAYDISLMGLLNGNDCEFTITREMFETECQDIFDRAMLPVQKVLSASGLDPTRITDVILAGGSSHIPLMVQKLEQFFHRTPYEPVNPQYAVAIGAAILARERAEFHDFSEAPFVVADEAIDPRQQAGQFRPWLLRFLSPSRPRLRLLQFRAPDLSRRKLLYFKPLLPSQVQRQLYLALDHNQLGAELSYAKKSSLIQSEWSHPREMSSM
jgi:molecular chaperone DnaK (HSP70)